MLTLPTIHLNGTGAADLREQARECLFAITEAQTKLQQNSPNARDYYPVAGAWEAAWAEHCARLQTLETMREEFLALAIHADNHAKEKVLS